MFNLQPYLLGERFGVTSYVYLKVILVRHAVLAVACICLLHLLKQRFEMLKGNVDGDNDFSGTISGCSGVAVVVPTDGLGKVIPRAEEIDSPGLSIVAGKDAAFGLLFRRKILVNPGNS
jgi:hypothetical protein